MIYKKINNKFYKLEDNIVHINSDNSINYSCPAYMVQPGFRIIVDGEEELVYDIDYSEYPNNNSIFYFLHIPKTAGMSVKTELLNAFKNKTIYSNFLMSINEEKMINSAFVSGHFAMYPIELAEKYKKQIKTYTILRDPLERIVSNFLYVQSAINNINDIELINKLEIYISAEYHNNLQNKFLSQSLNTDIIYKRLNRLRNNEISIEQYYSEIKENRDLKYYNNKTAIENLDKIDLVEILELRKDMSKINKFISQFGISYEIQHIKTNMNKISTQDFINKIPDSLKNEIVNLQEDDYVLYNYAIENRNAG